MLSSTDPSSYTASGAAYQKGGYTNYYFNSANHYLNGNTSITPATATISGYSWSISSDADVSASGTTATGTITVNTLPESDMPATITVTVTFTGGTPEVAANTTLTGTKEIIIQGTKPSAPTITVNGSTVTIATTAAGSPSIRYTLDGTTPTALTGTVYSGAIDLSGSATSPVTIKAVTVRNGNASDVSTEVVTLTLPTPVITANGTAGTATITCGVAGATIYYTTNGSTPTTGSQQYTTGLTGLTVMSTVKAIAVKDGWNNSAIASTTLTIPSGISDGVVTLFDCEPHSWAYYSDEDCPIRSLSPADVKITYYGDGIVMTGNADYTASSTDFVKPGQTNYTGGAKVNVGGEDENTFIYYKTLERGDATDAAWTFSSDNQGSAASRCPYTPIPNPFQVRPTYGARGDTDADNFTGWRGFQCWRLKSVSGGAVYSAASGGSALTAGAVINAETPIYFAPNSEYGMEVDFEAVWARAYLKKGNSGGANNILSQNVGVERNFMILTAGQNYRFDGTSGRYIGNKGYAVTISNYYPSGEAPDNTNSTISGYNDMTLGAATKFENVTFNSMGSYTLSANGKDLIIGRGCTGSVGNLYGATSAPTSNFTFRIESGSYTTSYLLSSVSGVTSGITINATYGCDYDRANNETNTNLTFSNVVELGYGSYMSSANGNANMTVLSGTFGTNAANKEFYLGFENGGGGTSQAIRTLEIYGGNFQGGIAGGFDKAGNSASSVKVNMRIRGGSIQRYLYGAGQYSECSGARRLVITGGTFNGWIAGGAYGTDPDGGATDGNINLYFGGTASQTNSDGIFGAGYGTGTYVNNQNYYTVQASNVVFADEASTTGSVYGGGNNGFARQNIQVYVAGGTVGGDVYGGANKAPSQGTVTVTVTKGSVTGGVYGGSNTSGAISGQITVDVYGTDPQPGSGYAINQVFGGGNQAAYASTPNVTVHCGDNISIGEVYGGGNAATVRGTNVVIEGGNKIGNVYGGCYGANVTNDGTKVNIKGGTIEHVYGGNNASGTITGGLKVRVKKDSECPMYIGELYGGGNEAGSAAGSIDIGCTGTYVEGDGGHADCNETTNRIGYELEGIGDVFGGANRANISGNISLTIDSGMVYRVFGGNNNSGTISGTITVNIQKTDPNTCGWYVGYVFGGGFNAPYNKDVADNPSVNVSAGLVSHSVYGGGKGSGAVVTGNPTVTLSGTATVGENVYGGGDAAGVTGNTSVILRD